MPHPLFPWDPETEDRDPEEEDERDITWIKVARWENGSWVYYPKSFRAEPDDTTEPEDVIRDLDDVFRRWGGGKYLFVARNRANARVTAQHGPIVIAGPSKPFFPEKAANAESSARAAPPPLAAGLHDGVIDKIAAISAALAPIVSPIISYFENSRREHEARMSQLHQEAREATRHAAELAAKTASTTIEAMGQLYARLAEHRSSPIQELKEAIELGAKLRGEAVEVVEEEEDEKSSILETVRNVAEVVHALQPPEKEAPNG